MSIADAHATAHASPHAHRRRHVQPQVERRLEPRHVRPARDVVVERPPARRQPAAAPRRARAPPPPPRTRPRRPPSRPAAAPCAEPTRSPAPAAAGPPGPATAVPSTGPTRTSHSVCDRTARCSGPCVLEHRGRAATLQHGRRWAAGRLQKRAALFRRRPKRACPCRKRCTRARSRGSPRRRASRSRAAALPAPGSTRSTRPPRAGRSPTRGRARAAVRLRALDEAPPRQERARPGHQQHQAPVFAEQPRGAGQLEHRLARPAAAAVSPGSSQPPRNSVAREARDEQPVRAARRLEPRPAGGSRSGRDPRRARPRPPARPGRPARCGRTRASSASATSAPGLRNASQSHGQPPWARSISCTRSDPVVATTATTATAAGRCCQATCAAARTPRQAEPLPTSATIASDVAAARNSRPTSSCEATRYCPKGIAASSAHASASTPASGPGRRQRLDHRRSQGADAFPPRARETTRCRVSGERGATGARPAARPARAPRARRSPRPRRSDGGLRRKPSTARVRVDSPSPPARRTITVACARPGAGRTSPADATRTPSNVTRTSPGETPARSAARPGLHGAHGQARRARQGLDAHPGQQPVAFLVAVGVRRGRRGPDVERHVPEHARDRCGPRPWPPRTPPPRPPRTSCATPGRRRRRTAPASPR